MDARLSDEQHLLAGMVEELASAVGTTQPAELDQPFDVDTAWSALVDVGLAGLHLAEEAGGSAASGVDVAIALEAFGRHVSRVPLLGLLCASEWLIAAGDGELAAVACGERRPAPGLTAGLTEPGTAVAFDALGATEAVGIGAGAVLCGTLGEALPSTDLTRTITTLEATATPTRLDAAARTKAEAFTLMALSADMVGVMDGALRVAVEHAKQRVQFDRPIGSFQAVQHLAAAQLVTIEAARGLTFHAAWALDGEAPQTALAAARSAKAYCSEAVRTVCEAAIQILGGIGMTWEHIAHIHLRRGLLDRTVLGDEHRQWAAIGGAT